MRTSDEFFGRLSIKMKESCEMRLNRRRITIKPSKEWELFLDGF